MTTDEFQQEAKRLRPQLLTAARRHLTDPTLAEDIVQDSLLRLWLMRDDLCRPVDALAKVLVRNLCIDHERRRRPMSPLHSNIVDEGDEQTEQVDRLMTIVDELPEQQRTLLRLRYLEGLRTAEVAEEADMSETAVRKALSRARTTVRRNYRWRWMAVSAGVLLLAGIFIISRLDRPAPSSSPMQAKSEDEEFVTVVYGRTYTDQATALAEMQRALDGLEGSADVESQLNDLLNID